MSQLKLLQRRTFAPLFWMQFCGAFNDNLFKNALVILVTYRALQLGSLNSASLVALGSGLFILPFFLFSALAGQLADKFSKTTMMRWVKLAEIALMGLAAVGFVSDSLPLLLATLFLMGLQSTFFGPAKYSVLPELLPQQDLTGGNALVETGTFLAILLGTVAGGLLIAAEPYGAPIVGAAVVLVAIVGWAASARLPHTAGADPTLRLRLNPFPPLWETLSVAKQNRSVFLSILGISWFWFFGASLLTLLPTYTKTILFADETVITLLLALFCVGIAFGSLLCERLGGRKLELGLVPAGSIGMSLAALDLAFFGIPFVATGSGELIDLKAFVTEWRNVRILVDFAVLAMCGGVYTVPLYTMVQQRAPEKQRSRVIAANNILNALFMVLSALMLMSAAALDLRMGQIFLALAVLNGMVAIYIYTVIPEFLLRFIAWTIAQIMYRIRVVGRDQVPEHGPAVLVSNHVSFVDWLLITTVTQRPIRFVMYHGFTQLPLVRFLFRDAKVIPIASAKESPELLDQAYDQIEAALAADELVCIFPEGKLTYTGQQSPFKPGVERIIARTPVPVVPIAINGMWGSFFSRKDGKPFRRPFRRFWSRVSLIVGNPVPASDVTAAGLEQRVAELANG